MILSIDIIIYFKSEIFDDMAEVAKDSSAEANLYVFLTNSEMDLNGCYGVANLGSLCDSTRDKRTSITRYLGGDAQTALVRITF